MDLIERIHGQAEPGQEFNSISFTKLSGISNSNLLPSPPPPFLGSLPSAKTPSRRGLPSSQGPSGPRRPLWCPGFRKSTGNYSENTTYLTAASPVCQPRASSYHYGQQPDSFRCCMIDSSGYLPWPLEALGNIALSFSLGKARTSAC